jgi:hypothetical protein
MTKLRNQRMKAAKVCSWPSRVASHGLTEPTLKEDRARNGREWLEGSIKR